MAIISAEQLLATLAQPAPALRIFDVSYVLGQPQAGYGEYLHAHIPGARYLHLDHDLCAPSTGSNGARPLPEASHFAATLASQGLRRGQPVVVYDRQSGAIASRAWWMLRAIGHTDVVLLDGGWPAWLQAGGAQAHGEPVEAITGDFSAPHDFTGLVTVDDVQRNLDRGELLIIDARPHDRFAGDASQGAGHIPGAVNRPYQDNLDENGRFKSPAQLRQAFSSLIGDYPGERLVLQCGSGVTSCHHAVALELASLPGSRLYPGSFSEWTADPARPIEH